MALRRSSVPKRASSSPPSPVLDLPPMRFMAMARVSCASFEMEPNDMAPVAKRLTISLGRLDFFERNGLVGRLDFQQAAQGAELAVLLVDQVGVFLEGLEALAAARRAAAWRWSADCRGDIRRRRGIDNCRRRAARGRTRLPAGKAWRCLRMASSASTSRPTPSMREAVPVKYRSTTIFVQADGFEDLRAAIALQRGDAHLGEGLQQTFVDGLHEIGDGFDLRFIAAGHLLGTVSSARYGFTALAP